MGIGKKFDNLQYVKYNCSIMMKKRVRICCVVDYLISDYSESLVRGAAEFCREKKLELLILPIGTLRSGSGHFTYQMLSVASHINSHNVDGVLFPTGTQMFNVDNDFLSSYLKSYNIKTVCLSYPVKDIPSLMVDCKTGFKSAIEHLIVDHGYRKLALMTVCGKSQEVRDRENIFYETLAEHGIEKEAVISFSGDFTTYTAHDLLYTYLKDCQVNMKHHGFDAIVALNDDSAFGCMKALKEAGFRIPEDVAVIGFDDIPRGVFEKPSLTTVSQQVGKQGYIAASLLYDSIMGKEIPMISEIPSVCKIRHSCGCRKDKCSFSSPYIEKSFDSTYRLKDEHVSQWFVSKDRLINAVRLYTTGNEEITLSELKLILNDKLRFFDIPGAAIVLYENPIDKPVCFDYFHLPKQAYIFSAYDNATGFETNSETAEVVFNPNEGLLPNDILKTGEEPLVVYELYHGSLHYGYAVIKIPVMELYTFDILIQTLATFFSYAYNNNLAMQEKNLFDQKYNKLMDIAITDELTGIRNRRGFMNLAESVMNVAHSMNQKGMMIFCDMDGLKKINDNFGHEEGDKAIIAESNILKKVFGEKYVLGRIGGDEFAVLATEMTEKEFLKCKKTVDTLCANWTKKNGNLYKLSISMGFQEFPSHDGGYGFRILLSEADAKLYIEKQEKKKKRK